MHKRGKDVVVAICDEDLLGSEIRAGSLRLRVGEEFYGGERIPLSSLREYLRDATIVNAIGNDVVEELAKWVDVVMDAAVELGGVLHVQLLLK